MEAIYGGRRIVKTENVPLIDFDISLSLDKNSLLVKLLGYNDPDTISVKLNGRAQKKQ